MSQYTISGHFITGKVDASNCTNFSASVGNYTLGRLNTCQGTTINGTGQFLVDIHWEDANGATIATKTIGRAPVTLFHDPQPGTFYDTFSGLDVKAEANVNKPYGAVKARADVRHVVSISIGNCQPVPFVSTALSLGLESFDL